MMPKCSACNSSEQVRRAHRYPFDRFLSLLHLLPFRCDSCDHRFYHFG
jgi:hypothetical protein